MEKQSEETKLALMQERIKNLETSVQKIMDNHLPHIQADIKQVSGQIDGLKDGISDLRVTVAKYIGVGIGGLSIVQVIIQFLR